MSEHGSTVTLSTKDEDNTRVIVHLESKEDPYGLMRIHKWLITLIVCFTSTSLTMLSSCWSLIEDSIMSHFHVGHEVATLGISFFVLGLGVGPLFLGPISEYHGRKVTLLVGLGFSISFQFLTAFCSNLGGMIFGRFMSGFFGSAFLSVSGGTISDIFVNDELSLPISFFSIAPFLGPGLGPFMSGFVEGSSISFRWVFYITLILTGTEFALLATVVPETYRPFLMKVKAQKLRSKSGDRKFFAPLEDSTESMITSILLSCKRPLLLLLRDPMMFLLCLYAGITLATLYLFFEAIPFVFSEVYHFGYRSQGLTFIGLIVGLIIASPTTLLSKRYYKYLTAQNNQVSEPEFNFPTLMIGGLVAPIGILILAWSAFPWCHWIGPVIGSAIFGIGIMLIFNGIISYTVDGYRLYAASALAANAFVRTSMSAVFPLFGLQMYQRLGVHWASTLLAGLSALMIPLPFIFYKYGAILRKRSPYAWSR